MAKVLIIEDDKQLSLLISDWLRGQGHLPEAIYKGAEGLERLKFYKYDLVILDWELPEISGPEICKEYRSSGGATPILMLTGKKELDDKEEGLDAGADDYLTKPFALKELGARLRALLRRPAVVVQNELIAGDITLRPGSRQAFKAGEELNLQPKELALLEFFMRHPNQPFSSEALLERVWVSDSDAAPDTVRIQIMRLRNKIDDDGKESMIRTVHRVGYMLVPPEQN
ncbi:MAG: response regulator transcription factor [Candidatus Obscuribacterales bacterium]|nr:response regulator transcription factor [Candidatus Obscuribacterales bacterium]